MSALAIAALTQKDYSAFTMMNYGDFGWGGGMMIFGWIIPVLITVLLVLAIAAPWKYINKK